MDTIIDIEPIKVLWQSVIMQAVLDLQKSKITIDWFSRKNPDFLEVCEYALLNPDMIIAGVNKIYLNKTKINNKLKVNND